jgi:hypothetical protein
MANYAAIYSVGFSLVRYLQNAYLAAQAAQVPPSDLPSCDFKLFSSGDMAGTPPATATLSLWLYRVMMNEHLRNAPRPADPLDARPPLALDLHYLMTVWTDSAVTEHKVLAWAMRELHQHEALSASDLSSEPGWSEGDLVQVIPAELSNSDLMRIWDAMKLSYRLSASYIARVVRIDLDAPASPAKPVVARRFTVTDTDTGS